MKAPYMRMVTWILLWTQCGTLSAGVPYQAMFLPGNAFFPIRFSKESLAEWSKTGEIQGEFARSLRGIGGFGHEEVGGKSIAIKNCPEVLFRNLRDAVHRIRRQSPQRVTFHEGKTFSDSGRRSEENRLCLFIHRRDFDFQEFSPFMQFNEHWVEEAAAMVAVAPVPKDFFSTTRVKRSEPLGRESRQMIYGTTYVDDFYRLDARDADIVASLLPVGSTVEDGGRVTLDSCEQLSFFLITEDRLTVHSLEVTNPSPERDVGRRGDLVRVTLKGVEELEPDWPGWKVAGKDDIE